MQLGQQFEGLINDTDTMKIFVDRVQTKLNRPLPGGRGFQQAREKRIRDLCQRIVMS